MNLSTDKTVRQCARVKGAFRAINDSNDELTEKIGMGILFTSELLGEFKSTHCPSNGIQSWILDSTPWIPDPRYWIPIRLGQWNLDFGFQSLVVFRIPKPWIPNSTSKISWIADSTTKNFPDSQIRIPSLGARHMNESIAAAISENVREINFFINLACRVGLEHGEWSPPVKASLPRRNLQLS